MTENLTLARQLAREWDDLAHQAAWNHHQLLKSRITEEAARAAIRSATPNDAFGILINTMVETSTDIITDLDEIIIAAEEIAGGMERMAWREEITEP